MKYKGNSIVTFDVDKFEDKRGYFSPMNVWLQKVVQANISYSAKGVIRGMHAQSEPFVQRKQLLVLEGSIDDVVAFPELGYIESFRLRAGQGIIVPSGAYHGFEVIKDAKIMYMVDNPYSPQNELIINPLTIPYKWKTENPIISDKDLRGRAWSKEEIIRQTTLNF